MFNLIKAILLLEKGLGEEIVNALKMGAHSGKDSLLRIVLGIYQSLYLSENN